MGLVQRSVSTPGVLSHVEPGANYRRTLCRRVLGCLLAGLVSIMALPSVGYAQAPPTSTEPLEKSPLALPKALHLPVIMHIYSWEGIATIIGHVDKKETLERFVVDTGLNACTVSSTIYTRYSLQVLPRNVHMDVFNTQTVAKEVHIDSLQFDLLRLEGLSAVLVNTFDLISNSPRNDAPLCWLGSPFLSAFQPTFDFANETLILDNARNKIAMEPGAVVLPMTLRDGRPYVKVTVPGVKTFQALIDTGAPASLLPGFLAAKLKLKPLQQLTIHGRSGKDARAGVAIFPRMLLGKREEKDIRAVFLGTDAPAEFDQNLAILGVDFLSRFKMTLDYEGKRVILTPPPAPEKSPTTQARVP